MSAATDIRVALRDLVERYALAVDERRLPDVATLFTTDGVLAVPRPPASLEPTAERVGHEAIETAMSSLHRFVATMHAIVGHVVELDGSAPERATGTTTCIAHHLIRDEGSIVSLVWGLRYHDEYAVEHDAWRFARRRLFVDWIEERPIALAREP